MSFISDTNSANESFISYKTINIKESYSSRHSSKLSIYECVPTGYHNLPTNVLFNIFSYLDEEDLRKRIIPVCHKWRLVGSHSQLWFKIKFVGLHIPQRFICQQIRTFTNLHSIYLNNISDVCTVIRQICRCTPNLTKIAVRNCENNETYDKRVPEKVLRNLVVSCRKLREINLKGTQFYGNLFYLEIATLPELKSLNLSNNRYFNTRNLLQLALNCRNLEEVKISNRNLKHRLTDDDATFLFSSMKATLKSVTFDMIGLTDTTLQTLLQCKKLEKLYLFNTINITADKLVQLRILPNLQYLKICNSQLDTKHLKAMFTEDGASMMCNLILLNLSGSWKLKTDGLTAIAECCRNLEKVVLKGCRNLQCVQSLLEKCRNITSLNLAFCDKLTNDDLQMVPLKTNNLKYYYLDSTRKSITEHLKTDYPKLNVYLCQSQFNNDVELL